MAKNLEKLSLALSTRMPSRRVSTVWRSSKPCKTASEHTPRSTLTVIFSFDFHILYPDVLLAEIMDDDEEEGAPTPTAGSDVPLHAESDDSKLNGQASSGVGAPQSSRIESTSASSDSS